MPSRQAVLTDQEIEAMVRRTLTLLHLAGSVVELRAPDTPTQGTVSGYFEMTPVPQEALASAAWRLSEWAPAVIVTLNPVKPECLARRVNHTKTFAKKGTLTTDGNIVARRWLLVDLDPDRASGISSTDAEHAAALDRVIEVRAWLRAQGCTGIILADSGNGAHILVRIDLPNDKASTALLQRVLAALAARFATPAVKVDKETFNAARLVKLYGTVAAKGDHTPERPHRRSRIIEHDDDLDTPTSREVLEAIAGSAPSPPPPTGSRRRGRTVDVRAFLTQHPELVVVSEGPWDAAGGAYKWALDICPWNPAHDNQAAFLIQFEDGGATAGCRHTSCSGKRWADLLAAVGEDRDEAPRAPAAVFKEDFFAYARVKAQYIWAPDRSLWPASSVNARIPPIDTGEKDEEGNPIFMSPSQWIDEHQPVEQMTWAPGEPMLIRDKILDGEWIARPSARVFNLYRPPTLALGDPTQIQPWLDHLFRLFPDRRALRHLICWLAHRVQRPAEKINHAIVLGGDQGIGKDTIFEPAMRAVGLGNSDEVSPGMVMGRFTGFLRNVILRINEAHDLGDATRYAFYERTKTMIVAPPATLRVDEKNLREYQIPNLVGVVITTNHLTDGLYLPANDRRHFVLGSEVLKDTMIDGKTAEEHARALWPWYLDGGGIANVAAYLHTVDLTDFDPKASPPKTAAFYAIVDAGRAPESDDMVNAVATLRNSVTGQLPAALTIEDLTESRVEYDFKLWLKDRRNARQIPHRLKDAGYVAVRNSDQKAGRWMIGGEQKIVYALEQLPDRYAAVRRYVHTRNESAPHSAGTPPPSPSGSGEPAR